MTLDEIAAHVTLIVGQTDSTSVSICKSFVQRRYQAIAAAHPWKDLEIPVDIVVTGGQNTVALTSSIDRVLSVRAENRFLDPVDLTYLIETDPGILERYGSPTMYQEYTDPAGSSRRLKVFPRPTVDTALLLVAKRAVTTLAGSDSSLIRNIDNALIAYVTGDMLERQRQYGKARSKYEEANALLEQAKVVETQQANRPRRAKGLTASGNSLAEMADAVCARIGDWALESTILVKDLLRRNYQTVYDASLWKESIVPAVVESDGEQLVLPEYMDRVISVRAAADLGSVSNIDPEALMSLAPSIFEQDSGTQSSFVYLTPVAVKVLPPGLEKLEFNSTSTSDKSTIFLRGDGEGEERTETITLNGTTPVVSTQFYDIPLTIAKQVTVGTVVVLGHTSTVELQRLKPNEIERKHMRLWFQPRNDTGTDCLVFGKRKIQPLISDDDTPIIRGIQNVLIEMTVADMLLKGGNEKGAMAAAQKAEQSMQRMLDMESRQGASSPRVIPTVEPTYSDYGGVPWFVAKS